MVALFQFVDVFVITVAVVIVAVAVAVAIVLLENVAAPAAAPVALKSADLAAAIASMATTDDVDAYVVVLDDVVAAVVAWESPAVAAA